MTSLRAHKGNIDRSDGNRALFTDTAPIDIPIVISNDGFHANLSREAASRELSSIVEKLITANGVNYTIPHRYRIRLTSTASRQISLAHPAAQAKASSFYRDFGHLIPFFCRHDAISLRRPAKIGSAVSSRTAASGKKHLKRSAIDTLLHDKTLRNPGSFFAYAGHDRLHAFFSSDEFFSLERRYAFLRMTDISKCFGSIYSHTLAWAIKDVAHGKESATHHSFANEFDRVMLFANFNETNGIPVGWEVSRLFAEIILQSVDVALIRRAAKDGIVFGRDFDVRRYIDDYMIFANSVDVADAVQRGLDEALGVFNLHINSTKTVSFRRPLHTPRSRVLVGIKQALERLRTVLLKPSIDGRRYLVHDIRDDRAVFRSFVEEVKAACLDSNADYTDVSPYAVGALSNLLELLIGASAIHRRSSATEKSNILDGISIIVDLMYFFIGTHSTVTSSYKVARSTILALRFFKKKLPELAPALQDKVRLHLNLAIQESEATAQKMSDHAPIELLNLLLAGTELSDAYKPDITKVAKRTLKSDSLDYFSIVCLLFYYSGNNAAFTAKLERKLTDDFLGKANPRGRSKDAHLILDLIACPHLTAGFRGQLLEALQGDLQLAKSSGVGRTALIAEIQANPWFVNWREIDLLNHLRKKELSAIY